MHPPNEVKTSCWRLTERRLVACNREHKANIVLDLTEAFVRLSLYNTLICLNNLQTLGFVLFLWESFQTIPIESF